MGSLAAGSAAAMGTGAFSAAQIDGRSAEVQVNNDASALIQLVPGHHSSVAGSDSTVTSNRVGYEDGQLFIDFDDSDDGGDGSGTGINPDSVYQVGAIGDTGQTQLENFVDSDAPGPDVSEKVLYGEAGNNGSSKTITDDPAFVIRNEADNSKQMTLSVDGTFPDEQNFTAGIALKNGSGEGAFAAAQSLGDDPEGYTNFTLGAGEEVGASLIVATTDDVQRNSNAVLDGSLTLNAGQAVADSNEP